MATARKPFIRIGTSLLREPWPRDVKMTLVMLSCFLADRWARDRLTAEEACSAVLTRDQLHAITGRAQIRHGRSTLRALGEHVTCTIRARGELTEIHWPKYAEFQELPSRGRELKARAKPRSAPAPAPAPKNSSSTSTHAASGDASPRGNDIQNMVLFDADRVSVADEIVSADRLVNLLAPYGTDRATKVAWLELELPLLICEVQALPGITTTQQAMAKLRALMIRYWRQELRNPGHRNGRPAMESFDEAHIREGREWLKNL